MINTVATTMIGNSRNYEFMILYVNKCEYQLQAPQLKQYTTPQNDKTSKEKLKMEILSLFMRSESPRHIQNSSDQDSCHSFLMSLHCKSLNKLPLCIEAISILLVLSTRQRNKPRYVRAFRPPPRLDSDSEKRHNSSVDSAPLHPKPPLGLVYRLSSAMRSAPIDITTHRSLVEAPTIFRD